MGYGPWSYWSQCPCFTDWDEYSKGLLAEVSAGNKPVVRNQVPVVEALQRGRPDRCLADARVVGGASIACESPGLSGCWQNITIMNMIYYIYFICIYIYISYVYIYMIYVLNMICIA